MKHPINVELIKLAQRWGYWDGNTAEFNDVGLEEFAAAIAEPLHERIKDLYRQLDEAEKQLDQQYKMGMKCKLDECILILERLYERSGEQYKQYLHAARVLKREV
jgi:hypothetical protein